MKNSVIRLLEENEARLYWGYQMAGKLEEFWKLKNIERSKDVRSKDSR